MANVNFQITFRGGELTGNLVRFDPGSRMEAVAQIMPLENVRAKRIVARVGWHTEGRGDRDSALVGQMDIAQGGLTANTPINQAFAIDLPRQPWSFAGHYVNIIWDVRLTVDIPFGGDIEAVQPFIVAPKRT